MISYLFRLVLAQKILNEPKFSPMRCFAFILSLSGLITVSWHNLSAGNSELIGIIYVLLGMFFFSLSAVLVKSVSINIHPFATTLGALYFTVPLFFISWLLLDGDVNTSLWSYRSLSAILYLGIFGSLIGFIAYFYILQKLATTHVALITLITPSFAIGLGALINDETIDQTLIIGACLVLCGLAIYHWGEKLNVKQYIK